MARKEKELHAKSFPNWSARDNYGLHSKRKKKREVTCQHIADKGIYNNEKESCKPAIHSDIVIVIQ